MLAFRKPDLRKRRDAIARQVEGFEPQMDAITDAYIEWSREVGDNLDHTLADPPAKDVEKYYEMVVVDIYRAWLFCMGSSPITDVVSRNIYRAGPHGVHRQIHDFLPRTTRFLSLRPLGPHCLLLHTPLGAFPSGPPSDAYTVNSILGKEHRGAPRAAVQAISRPAVLGLL